MNLIDLKPFLDDVTDSFAAVLDLEFTIINSEPMQRVSGTGAYRDMHRKHWEGTYSALVKKTGKPMVVLEPSEYRLELERFKQNTEYAIILYPIARGDRMEGVIVLASFTPEQKKNAHRADAEAFELSGKDRLPDPRKAGAGTSSRRADRGQRPAFRGF